MFSMLKRIPISGQSILTKGRIAGVDFSRTEFYVTPAGRRQYSGLHACIDE